jgi:SEC-C motif domain protein
MRRPISPDALCPCGSGRSFGECCEPLLKETRSAATAGELMRSRFTAHVVGDYHHLHRTYLGTARRPYVEEPAGDEMKWTRLVVHAEEPGPKPGMAFVDFSAYHQEGEAEHALHEKAEFALIDGSWIYTRPVRSGPAPLKSTAPKVGRNDPCPCGSGKKFKHCCGR